MNNSGNILVEGDTRNSTFYNLEAKVSQHNKASAKQTGEDDVVNFEMARQDSQPSMPESMVESAAFGVDRKGSQGSLASLTSGKLSMRVEKAQARKFKRKMLD